MTRWLFNSLCALFFALPIGMGLLHAWPHVTARPNIGDLNSDALLIGGLALLTGAGLVMLLGGTLAANRKRP
jgi:hypothetical protein